MTRYKGSFEEAARVLAAVIDGSVAGEVAKHKKVAVAFSGGLDSSIMVACAKRRTKVLASSASAQGALDEGNARRASEALGVELVTTKLTREVVKSELEGIDLPFQPTLMDKSLWCLYSIVSRMAAKAGAEIVLLGQVADELFGGYRKYQTALRERGEVAAELLMRAEVEAYRARGMVRDVSACSRWLEPRFPFLAKEVIELGLSLPVSYKIRKGVRKAVLREAASVLNLPDELTTTPKKAAQYSSGIQKIVG